MSGVLTFLWETLVLVSLIGTLICGIGIVVSAIGMVVDALSRNREIRWRNVAKFAAGFVCSLLLLVGLLSLIKPIRAYPH